MLRLLTYRPLTAVGLNNGRCENSDCLVTWVWISLLYVHIVSKIEGKVEQPFFVTEVEVLSLC